MITTKNLDFSYSKKANLISSLNLEVSAGRIHGLLGKNGEGKSTLLKLFTGILFPTHGEIQTMGFNPRDRKPEMLADVYFLPEELPTVNLSVQKFEKIYAPFYPHFSAELFNQYLKDFEVEDKKKVIEKHSLGEKRKILLAFAIATNTKLLLLDEPTNGLDIPSKAQFRKIIASTIDESKCLIISTHQVKDLDSLIDSIIILKDHQIKFHQNLVNITEKLQFKFESNTVKTNSVLYSEETPRGKYIICPNETGEESKLDIEMLFNGIHANESEFTAIFKS
jgi:ABC-2 type transport system ATP-binding protein